MQGKGTTDAWNKFVAGSADNVLLDFSYAGYKHGEEEAPDGFALGYKTINVKEYMDAHPDLTAREAFLKLLKEKSWYALTTKANRIQMTMQEWCSTFRQENMCCIMRRIIR